MKITLFRLFVFAFMVAIIGTIMHNANAQSTEQDLNQTIDQQSTELIQSCSTVFDTVNIGSIYSKICASIMDSINDQCRDNYFVFCFGQSWINYEDNHKAYGSSEHKSHKCQVIKYEDNSKGKICIGQKRTWYDNDNGTRGQKHTCTVTKLLVNDYVCKGARN